MQAPGVTRPRDTPHFWTSLQFWAIDCPPVFFRIEERMSGQGDGCCCDADLISGPRVCVCLRRMEGYSRVVVEGQRAWAWAAGAR